MWVAFGAVVLVMLALDLGVFHRKAHVIGTREAALWSAVWISVALLFNLGIYFRIGSDRALEFFQAWLIEKALSVDNLFVFLVAFSYFAVPPHLQHRVLFWGILGALITRGLFIAHRRGAARALSLRHLHVRRVPDLHGRAPDARRRRRTASRRRTRCCGCSAASSASRAIRRGQLLRPPRTASSTRRRC